MCCTRYKTCNLCCAVTAVSAAPVLGPAGLGSVISSVITVSCGDNGARLVRPILGYFTINRINFYPALQSRSQFAVSLTLRVRLNCRQGEDQPAAQVRADRERGRAIPAPLGEIELSNSLPHRGGWEQLGDETHTAGSYSRTCLVRSMPGNKVVELLTRPVTGRSLRR